MENTKQRSTPRTEKKRKIDEHNDVPYKRNVRTKIIYHDENEMATIEWMLFRPFLLHLMVEEKCIETRNDVFKELLKPGLARKLYGQIFREQVDDFDHLTVVINVIWRYYDENKSDWKKNLTEWYGSNQDKNQVEQNVTTK